MRAKLAEHWGVPPWQVDSAPPGEVELQLDIWACEARYTPKPE